MVELNSRECSRIVVRIDAINGVDWPVVQGILILSAAVVIFSNLLSDWLYALIDPRIQLG